MIHECGTEPKLVKYYVHVGLFRFSDVCEAIVSLPLAEFFPNKTFISTLIFLLPDTCE